MLRQRSKSMQDDSDNDLKNSELCAISTAIFTDIKRQSKLKKHQNRYNKLTRHLRFIYVSVLASLIEVKIHAV